jgi:glycyl-tRNA synthetase beta chain
MNATLLIELLTEELPPKALPRLAASFAQTLCDELKKMQFAAADAEASVFASPRRLALSLPGVLAVQPEQHLTRKGPAVSAGMKDGKPTPALAGFARSCGVDVADLITLNDGKQDVYAWQTVKAGQPLSAVLSDLVALALKKLPAPKLMRWGDSDHQFVRPVHGLVLMHGDALIAGNVLGLESRACTLGHRFLSSGEVAIAHADTYAATLESEGRVVAGFDERRERIRRQLGEATARLGATLASDEALLDEVTALVEWPVVLEAGFDAEFLAVPQECLILTMQQNQKYFPLLDAQGRLMNRFLLVSNLASRDPSAVIQGNERVLRARLSDARFFFEQDQKTRLEARLERLAGVVYHNKIGSQLERVARLSAIAGQIAERLGADVEQAQRAARLAKADLVSDMVGEFPELQGVMGMYYARLDGEAEPVALAIEGHYHPRFAGDSLPQGAVATAVALADKLETLVGIWGIGLIPTGDKDPFALRRAALGVLRMALELPLDLKELLALTAASFDAGTLAPDVVEPVFAFCLERLKHFLGAEHRADEVDAVLALTPSRLQPLPALLAAVTAFRQLPQAAALAAANKRVGNILKKADAVPAQVDAALLVETAEKALYAAVRELSGQVDATFAAGDYSAALAMLSGLKEPVDAFFDTVMVMAEDAAVRTNRIALLANLAALFNRVADISLLAE